MNANALKAEFVRNGLTQAQVAKLIGVSESTMCRKMREGSFGLDEANKLIALLKIEKPDDIFFAKQPTL